MGKILESLNEYFKNTPKEVLDKDWEEIKPLNDIGPDSIEYCKTLREMFQPQGGKK